MACNISNLAHHTCIASVDLTHFYKRHSIILFLRRLWSQHKALIKLCIGSYYWHLNVIYLQNIVSRWFHEVDITRNIVIVKCCYLNFIIRILFPQDYGIYYFHSAGRFKKMILFCRLFNWDGALALEDALELSVHLVKHISGWGAGFPATLAAKLLPDVIWGPCFFKCWRNNCSICWHATHPYSILKRVTEVHIHPT